jgi:hypothetical protein
VIPNPCFTTWQLLYVNVPDLETIPVPFFENKTWHDTNSSPGVMIPGQFGPIKRAFLSLT